MVCGVVVACRPIGPMCVRVCVWGGGEQCVMVVVHFADTLSCCVCRPTQRVGLCMCAICSRPIGAACVCKCSLI